VTNARLTRLASLVVAGAKMDRSQSSVLVATRNTIGVAAPLVLAVSTGSAASAGLAATIGALQTSFADRPGPYRLRLLRMLATAGAAAMTSTLAVAASRSDGWSVALLFVLALLAGLLLTGGPSATSVGVAGLASALVLGHLSQPASNAVHVGLLVLAGGAGQVVLAIAAWPLGRHRPERLALAGVYRDLAALTRAPLDTSAAPPNVVVLADVRQTLYGLGHDHGPSVEAYRVLLDEAERIRREVLVLGATLEWLDDERFALRKTLSGVADVLDAIAFALERARRVDPELLNPAREAIRETTSALDETGELGHRAASARLRALAGQLRAAIETAAVGASEGRVPEAHDVSGLKALRSPVAILRANLSPDSAVLRHSIRLALLVAGSDLVVRLAHIDRGYWVPLTILVVLRPDFGTTFQRGVLRVVGTVVGLLLATALVHYVPGGDWYRIGLIAMLCFGLRLAGVVNVAQSAVCLAGLVVVLLAVQGVPTHTAVLSRAVATLTGGALAIVATLVRPSWERTYVRTKLADLLGAYRDYLAAIADLDSDVTTLQRARAASRLARTNAQASVDRARAEPVATGDVVDLGAGVLAHSHRVIHALLTLDALRPALRKAGRVPGLLTFLVEADRTLSAAEAALRDGTPSPSVSRLRSMQVDLAEWVLADTERVGGDATAGALVDASDRLTNSLDTLVALLNEPQASMLTV